MKSLKEIISDAKQTIGEDEEVLKEINKNIKMTKSEFLKDVNKSIKEKDRKAFGELITLAWNTDKDAWIATIFINAEEEIFQALAKKKIQI